MSEKPAFRPAARLTPQAIAAICEQVRVRVLRWFARGGLIDSDDVREMFAWENSGFSLDAEVQIAARDRAGLERRLRFCARPPFALERLDLVDDQHLIYRLPKAQRDGPTALFLTPLELIDQLAALIPPPRRHRHRYHGVLAPNYLPSLPGAQRYVSPEEPILRRHRVPSALGTIQVRSLFLCSHRAEGMEWPQLGQT